MGIADELRSSFGEDFFEGNSERSTAHRWNGLCVCGHLDRYHAPSIGGEYRIPEPHEQSVGGQPVTVTVAFGGCVGAVKARGFEETTVTADRDARTIEHRINPTCPCASFRAVAEVDRPNRYFCQRLPLDSGDRERHPFLVGMRAFMTHLSKRKAALDDPDWAALELDRRFRWILDARICAVARCRTAADDVWPVFVDGDPARSELRCSTHR